VLNVLLHEDVSHHLADITIVPRKYIPQPKNTMYYAEGYACRRLMANEPTNFTKLSCQHLSKCLRKHLSQESRPKHENDVAAIFVQQQERQTHTITLTLKTKGEILHRSRLNLTAIVAFSTSYE
jgi:hypothetical protein